jgi:alpha-glucosidase
MKNKFYLVVILMLANSLLLVAQKNTVFDVKSIDGLINLHVEAGAQLQWSVQHQGQKIIEPSPIAMQLDAGEMLGVNVKVQSSALTKNMGSITAINYKKSTIPDEYNQLVINFRGDYGIRFRVYNEGVAYRFFTKKKGAITVINETTNFNFTGDQKALIPIAWDYRDGKKFNQSFESLYRDINISKFPKDSMAFLPVVVDAGDGKRAAILEADLEDYPGMYLDINSSGNGFKGVFSQYPLETKNGGYNGINIIPTKRADFIARTTGTREFPWRIVVISVTDKELLNNDIVQKLASPSRLTDVSWIQPGLVSWDWWNDWNISRVDFRAGINNETYKYYIDFAAANKIPYIIMDGGWSDEKDLTRVAPGLNVQEIVDYGKQKNVGVILWASWLSVTQQMDKMFPIFSKMGIKGLKIDFFDRDDQVAVASTYEIAQKAAEYHLMVDYHGIYKPTGLQRTYPNVVGYEGVKGAENLKWAIEDAPGYAVTIPFIRMMAGPMDYTPGAMKNANKANFRPLGSSPMSQGTRCMQLAMYVMYEAPLQMLCDNPTIYMKEQECTDFICKMPTTFDETVALDGKIGEFAAIARRKSDTWYVGAMSNWKAREILLDFTFLGKGNYQAEVFRDGINADRDASDYKKELINISAGDKIAIKMAPGGGWAAIIRKK